MLALVFKIPFLPFTPSTTNIYAHKKLDFSCWSNYNLFAACSFGWWLMAGAGLF
jgi:hypothetical protein